MIILWWKILDAHRLSFIYEYIFCRCFPHKILEVVFFFLCCCARDRIRGGIVCHAVWSLWSFWVCCIISPPGHRASSCLSVAQRSTGFVGADWAQTVFAFNCFIPLWVHSDYCWYLFHRITPEHIAEVPRLTSQMAKTIFFFLSRSEVRKDWWIIYNEFSYKFGHTYI